MAAIDRLAIAFGALLAAGGAVSTLNQVTEELRKLQRVVDETKIFVEGRGIDWEKFLNITGIDARWQRVITVNKRRWADFKAVFTGDRTAVEQLERQLDEIDKRLGKGGSPLVPSPTAPQTPNLRNQSRSTISVAASTGRSLGKNASTPAPSSRRSGSAAVASRMAPADFPIGFNIPERDVRASGI